MVRFLWLRLFAWFSSILFPWYLLAPFSCSKTLWIFKFSSLASSLALLWNCQNQTVWSGKSDGIVFLDLSNLVINKMLNHFRELSHSSLLQCSAILDTVFNHSWYSVQLFLLQCSTIFHWTTVLNLFCYSDQSFLLQCAIILVNSSILHAIVLSHFSLSYNAQPFSTATVLMHPRYYSAQSFLLLQCSLIPHVL
jgi:hypothetical protein